MIVIIMSKKKKREREKNSLSRACESTLKNCRSKEPIQQQITEQRVNGGVFVNKNKQNTGFLS